MSGDGSRKRSQGESTGLGRGQHSCISAVFLGFFRNLVGDSNATYVWWERGRSSLQCEKWQLGSKELLLRRVGLAAQYRNLEEAAGKIGPLDLEVRRSWVPGTRFWEILGNRDRWLGHEEGAWIRMRSLKGNLHSPDVWGKSKGKLKEVRENRTCLGIF